MHPRQAVRERVADLLTAAAPGGWSVSSTRVSASRPQTVIVSTPNENAARGGTCEAFDRAVTIALIVYVPAHAGIDDAADAAAWWIEPAIWGDDNAFSGVATDISAPQTSISKVDESEEPLARLVITFTAGTQLAIS